MLKILTAIFIIIDTLLILFNGGTDPMNNIFGAQIFNILAIPIIVMLLTVKTVVSKPQFPDLNIKYFSAFGFTITEYLKYEFSVIMKKWEIWTLALYPLLFIALYHKFFIWISVLLIALNIVLLLSLTFLSILLKNFHYKSFWILIQVIGITFIFATRLFYKSDLFSESFIYHLGYSVVMSVMSFIGIFILQKNIKTIPKDAEHL